MLVYKHYDQDALDKQFNNRLHVPDYEAYFNRWTLLSTEAEKELAVIKDIAYGDLERERLDVFPSSLPNSKTLIFIHGGYWQMLDKAMFRFVASAFHSYGITTVLLTYPLAPAASIDQIVLSCRNGLKWVYKNIAAFNGNPNQIYVAGHSAGGHLAAMLMITDWKLLCPDLPPDVLKGVFVISGLFNLVPVRLSYLNQVLKMDTNTSFLNSPVNFKPKNSCPLVIAAGGAETTEFNDQSKELYAAWKDKEFDSKLLVLEQLNHFSIIETMIDPNSVLHLQIRQLMEV